MIACNEEYRRGARSSRTELMCRFKGTTMAVFGSLDAIRGGFKVSLDGQEDGQTYSAYRPEYMADVPCEYYDILPL